MKSTIQTQHALCGLLSGLSAITVPGILCLAGFSATTAHAVLVVTSGTGQIGNGVSLSISQNQVRNGGDGDTVGGKIHSPSGDPDLFFRAASTPTFPGVLDTYVEWSIGGSFNGSSWDDYGGWEGSVSGTDNWMKVIRNGDGAVTWAQFNFQLEGLPAGTSPTLLGIPKYVWSTDGADFTVAQAAATTNTVAPEPTSALLLLGSGAMLLLRRRRTAV